MSSVAQTPSLTANELEEYSLPVLAGYSPESTMRRWQRGMAALALAGGILPMTGCCTLFELFCGPDESDWVSEDYRTPDRALATFLEALRRDNSTVLYRCLSESMKSEFQIPSYAVFAVGWERVKSQVTGFHLLAGATISGPEPLDPGRVRFELERSGYRFEAWLVQQSAWEVAYVDEGDLVEYGEFVPSLAPHLSLRSAGDGLFRVRTESNGDLGIDALSMDRIQRAGIVRDWRIARIRNLE